MTVGKIKEKYFTMAIDEYSKRLSRYVKLDIVEVPDEKTPDGASETEEENIRIKEGEKILKNVKDDSYVVTLEIEGKMLDSVELSEKILNTANIETSVRVEKLDIQTLLHLSDVVNDIMGSKLNEIQN